MISVYLGVRGVSGGELRISRLSALNSITKVCDRSSRSLFLSVSRWSKEDGEIQAPEERHDHHSDV